VTALTRLLTSSPFRLTLAYLGMFVVAAAVIVMFVAWRANELLTTKVVETLAAEITGLREQFEAGGPERLSTVITQRAAQPGSSLYLLIGGGRKIAGNLEAVPPELEASPAGSIFRYARPGETGRGLERRAVGVALPVPTGLLLIVGRDIEDLHRFAETMGELGLFSIGLLSLFGIGAGLLISRSVLGRIEAVTDASRTIMAGDLSKRIPRTGSGDELDRLSASLNAMLARIEELVVALREVSDNIAHDLKTPLTRLRNRAEAALRRADGAAYRDGLTKTLEEADELIKTFNSLLLIARLEGGAMAESMGPVDPAAIIGDVAELYEPAAEEVGLKLKITSAYGLAVFANRELVSQAVANLVDNAIKYATGAADAGDGSISISLGKVADRIEITVADHGPGVAPEDRERALKRFVRLEKSRSLPGSGLGLSLVAAVARLHGGSIRLEDNAPGLRAILALPLLATGGPQPGPSGSPASSPPAP
jgi:signal transduction histidine kinase